MFRNAVTFFKEFVRHPRQLGSVIPSSGFLKDRIVRTSAVANARLIVELGPGHGGTTRAILEAMSPDATLLSIEINEGLYWLTRQIKDNRYIPHQGDARQLAPILAAHQLQLPDVIISGIPFSNMDPATGKDILRVIHEQLAPNGRFVAYQLSNQVDKLNGFFDVSSRSCEFEWLSIPPMKVWCWTKTEHGQQQ